MSFKLDPQIKNDWVKALRSGSFVQGTGYLCKEGAHCCLGVYAELASLPQDFIVADSEWVQYENSFYYLPNSHIPQIVQNRLSRMNDEGSSFDDIADYIEENL